MSALTLTKVIDEMWDLFDKQDQAYRDSVILPDVKARLAASELPTDVRWRHLAIDLSQGLIDLLCRKPRLLHRLRSPL